MPNIVFTPDTDKKSIADHFLSFVLDLEKPKTSFLRLDVFKMLFIEKNTKMLEKAQTFFLDGLKTLTNTLNKQKQLLSNERQKNYVYRIVSLLPYFDWWDELLITIPVLKNNKWCNIEFAVKKIRLSPVSLFLNERDVVYAYGLKPLFRQHERQSTNEAILVFSGTTYPQGEGYISHIMSDLNGFQSPGQDLIDSGRDEINEWMKNNNIEKVNVLGHSLGGSMSILWAYQNPQQTQAVYAFNPPGLLNIPKESLQAPITVITHQYDIVSKFGYWHPDWKVLEISAPTDFKNPFTAHLLNFGARTEAEYKEVNVEEENKKRWWYNFWVYKVLRCVIYTLLILPYFYIIRPMLILLDWIVYATLFCLLFPNLFPLLSIIMALFVKNLLIQPDPLENIIVLMVNIFCLLTYLFLVNNLAFLIMPIIIPCLLKFSDVIMPDLDSHLSTAP